MIKNWEDGYQTKNKFAIYCINYLVLIMVSFLLPFAYKIIDSVVSKIPDDAELGEKLIEICLVILGKAVKLTKTEMDDQLLEVVSKAIKAREEVN